MKAWQMIAAGMFLAAGWTMPAPAQSPSCVTAVTTAGGSVCGLGVTAGGTSLVSYRGIPYAAPPTGTRRWQPPAAAPGWSGVRQATSFGSICPQTQDKAVVGAEDCLFLNVWTPQTTAGSPTRRPVMVFIHGGAFIEGAGSLPVYDGSALSANGNVVVVTLNYRLGSLGFLTVQDSHYGVTIPGNLGLLDQRAALSWVQSNISAFGGDPTKVTIFGESAGAMSVGLHLFAAPGSTGLFRAAIMESNPMAVEYPSTVSQFNANWRSFFNSICSLQGQSCPKTPSLAWLQSLPLSTVMAAQGAYSGLLRTLDRILTNGGLSEALPWTPVVDGATVMDQPFKGYVTGASPKPLIFGVNANEGALFSDLVYIESGNALSADKYGALRDALFGVTYSTRIGLYNSGTFLKPVRPYSAYDQTGVPAYFSPAAQALSTLINDFAFRCGNLMAAQAVYYQQKFQASVPPTYAYLFTQPPLYDTYGAGVPACTAASGNVCHGNELPYVFNTLGNNVNPVPTADAVLAQTMGNAWTAFASTLQAPGWTTYSPAAPTIRTFGSGAAPSSLATAANCPGLWQYLPPYAN